MLTIFANTHIDFMTRRRSFFIVSAVLILASLVSIIAHGGLRLGIDFAGGRLVEVRLSERVPIQDLRGIVGRAGYPSAELQGVRGTNDVLIRIPLESAELASTATSETIRSAIAAARPGLSVELLREESVGSKIGREIRGQAFWAILLSLGLILIYIALRFELRFGLGAVIALAHDVIIVLGIFSLLNKQITMPVVAALLTIAGYSINDTIVVFDRIREQLVRLRREPFERVVNVSINQTLSRTVITALTTLFTSGALMIFGGEVLHDFAFAMSIGIIIGTYSSIFVASALVLEIRHSREGKGRTQAQA